MAEGARFPAGLRSAGGGVLRRQLADHRTDPRESHAGRACRENGDIAVHHRSFGERYGTAKPLHPETARAGDRNAAQDLPGTSPAPEEAARQASGRSAPARSARRRRSASSAGKGAPARGRCRSRGAVARFGCAECGGTSRVRARERCEACGLAAVEVDEAVAVVVEAVRAGRHLVGPDVAAARCAAVTLARTHTAALVLRERDLGRPRVAVVVVGAGRARDRVDRRAAELERVRRRGTAVVLERAEEWIDVGEVGRIAEVPAAVGVEVVAERA